MVMDQAAGPVVGMVVGLAQVPDRPCAEVAESVIVTPKEVSGRVAKSGSMTRVASQWAEAAAESVRSESTGPLGPAGELPPVPVRADLFGGQPGAGR